MTGKIRRLKINRSAVHRISLVTNLHCGEVPVQPTEITGDPGILQLETDEIWQTPIIS